jgi:hypothetical protein
LWQLFTIDFTDYSGNPIEVSITYLTATGASTKEGVYIDYITIDIDGSSTTESFENGLGNWKLTSPYLVPTTTTSTAELTTENSTTAEDITTVEDTTTAEDTTTVEVTTTAEDTTTADNPSTCDETTFPGVEWVVEGITYSAPDISTMLSQMAICGSKYNQCLDALRIAYPEVGGTNCKQCIYDYIQSRVGEIASCNDATGCGTLVSDLETTCIINDATVEVSGSQATSLAISVFAGAAVVMLN